MTKQKLKDIRRRCGRFASFAVWDENDVENLSVLNNANTLHTKAVFVGLNATALVRGFKNFHSSSRFDKRLMRALNTSSVRGAYLTDIAKEVFYVDSKLVIDEIKTNERIKDKFLKELEAIGGQQAYIVAMGGAAHLFLRKWLPGKQIHKMYHPAAWQISDNTFYKSVAAAIRDYE